MRRLVALALVALLCAGCTSSAHRSSLVGQVDATLAAGCPSPDRPMSWAPDGRLPAGATTVRLCNVRNREGIGRTSLSLQAPADALTTGVDGVVAAVNSLPHQGPNSYCGGVGAAVTAFWFGYPDGREFSVLYPNGGCYTTVAAGDDRIDGDRVQLAFVAALRAQRASRTPPAPLPPPSCMSWPGQTLSTVADIRSLPLVSAVACALRGRKARLAVLTPDQLALINGDVHAGPATTVPPTCPLPFQALRIVAYDAWGDRMMLEGNCNSIELPTVVFGFGADEPYWTPSPAVLTLLEGLDYGPWVRSASRPQPRGAHHSA